MVADGTLARMPPFRVLVIARWYPAVDDAVRGSFVADQVDALTATGEVEPTVASFEFVRLNRVPDRREPEREAIHARYGPPARERTDALVRGGWPVAVGTWSHLASVPIARLPVASGPEDPPSREGDDHGAVFAPFIRGIRDRWPSDDLPPFDLIHAHTGFPDGELAASAARTLGIPYVVTEHSSRTRELLQDPEVRRRYAAVVEGATRVIVVSRALGAELRTALPELAGTLDERLVVVPNLLPVDLFRAPGRTDRRAGELLYVGTRKPDKGIATLLDAFALARRRRPDLTLRLIGRSPTADDEAAWRARAADLAVPDAVSFEPPVDRAGVADAMARADLFVHPSRYETFGVVVAEALASGLPIVATRSGGVEDIVDDGRAASGALVNVDDAPAMAEAILAMLERRDRIDPAAMRADATARFGADAVARRLLEVYREAASGPFDSRGGRDAGGSRALSEAPPATVDAGDVAKGGRPAQGLADGPTPIVVAFNRIRAARLLGTLPPDLLGALTLVTVRDPGEQPLPAGIGTVLAADLDTDFQAAVRDVRRAAPPRGLRGRIVRLMDPGAPERIAARLAEVQANHAGYRLETARRTVSEAAGSRGTPDLVCLDGYDVVAAGLALDAGAARLCPGGIRWLADTWAAGVLQGGHAGQGTGAPPAPARAPEQRGAPGP
jgi:glycosyltransferase involved in cell wall biosynthesis